MTKDDDQVEAKGTGESNSYLHYHRDWHKSK